MFLIPVVEKKQDKFYEICIIKKASTEMHTSLFGYLGVING